MKKQKKTKAGSRRTFLRGLAVTPLVPAAVATAILPEIAESQVAPDSNNAQVNALADVVRARFGSYLAEGDMEEIKRGIERNLRYASALSKVKLTNADEPDFTFFADGPPQD